MSPSPDELAGQYRPILQIPWVKATRQLCPNTSHEMTTTHNTEVYTQRAVYTQPFFPALSFLPVEYVKVRLVNLLGRDRERERESLIVLDAITVKSAQSTALLRSV